MWCRYFIYYYFSVIHNYTILLLHHVGHVKKITNLKTIIVVFKTQTTVAFC